jgi:uncharacterized membrane protein
MKNFFLFTLLLIIGISNSSCSSKLQTEDVLQNISSTQLEIESRDSRYLEYAPYFENEFSKVKSLRKDSEIKYILLVKIEPTSRDLSIDQNVAQLVLGYGVKVKYFLYNIDKTQILLTKDFEISSSKPITSSDYANYTELDMTNIQLILEAAKNIIIDLSLYFKINK